MHGAVAYLSFVFKDGTTNCCFVMGKFQFVPMENFTMPRRELNAAVIGIKLHNFKIHETDLLIEKKQVLVGLYANITVYTG